MRILNSLIVVPTNEQVRQLNHVELLDMKLIEDRMVHNESWNRKRARHAIRGYKRFLAAIVLKDHYDASISPNKEIDEIWHNHILHTQKYAADCQKIFGRYIHHMPYTQEYKLAFMKANKTTIAPVSYDNCGKCDDEAFAPKQDPITQNEAKNARPKINMGDSNCAPQVCVWDIDCGQQEMVQNITRKPIVTNECNGDACNFGDGDECTPDHDDHERTPSKRKKTQLAIAEIDDTCSPDYDEVPLNSGNN